MSTRLRKIVGYEIYRILYRKEVIMAESMLTTVDNPYNPFVQFDEWKAFDEQKGYYTCEYLARIAKTSHELSDEMNSIAIENAINQILFFDLLGIYQKVTKENFDKMKSRDPTPEQKEALDLMSSS